MKSLKEFIETYKDYPKKGIEFKDVLGIIQEPIIFKELILKMSSSQIIKNAEAIISIDARGFIFGSAISLQASKPMIVARNLESWRRLGLTTQGRGPCAALVTTNPVKQASARL